MTLDSFTNKLQKTPTELEFTDTIALIETLYNFSPTAFKNGDLTNEAGQNNGSCKIFAFAKLQQYSKEETLACFGKFYTQDVLENPNGNDHQNIRNFMTYGWEGIDFKGIALSKK